MRVIMAETDPILVCRDSDERLIRHIYHLLFVVPHIRFHQGTYIPVA
jgi:hypothetical protein